MDMHDVDSSNLQRVGYDPEDRTLAIEFKNGDTYNYEEVPEFVYEELMRSSSLGTYFHQNIRNTYSFHKS